MRPDLAVCSWSLRPAGPEELCEMVRAAGLGAVQLALDPVRTQWGERRTAQALRSAGIRIVSGMMAMAGEDYSTLESIRRTGGVRPDQTWETNLSAARENAALARDLGISHVSFHAGFLPHGREDPERARMLSRLRELSGIFAESGIRAALETGQESAHTLQMALVELPGIGVNFDPANMILYGMGDPVEALRTLAPHVRQLHIKDAVPSDMPGEWGRETVVGEGAVNWGAFFEAYRDTGMRCPLVIEREAGESRVEDVIRARALVERLFARGTR